jgi:L-aspartate oxidase
MAARAGAAIADAEFVQFHPTAIDIGRDPAPLATEALRGEGALLVDERGRRFMQAVHAAGELAPRDVVARAIHREIAQGHRIFLDCRAAIGDRFASRFPTVHAACLTGGIDPAVQPIPLAPAAHYHMGGIAAGHSGRSTLPGLWCAGECASTGLHGANRLASNSLLEALVFGARIAADVSGSNIRAAAFGDTPAAARFTASAPPRPLRDAMMRGVGLERDEQGLVQTLAAIASLERASGSEPSLMNMIVAAKLVAAAALARRESVGAHFRRDFPLASETPKRSLLTLADAESIVREILFPEESRRSVVQ